MLKTIDLFAGAGGLSLGFQLTNKFELLAAAEINKNARKTYKRNIAKNENFIFIDNVIGYDFKALNDRLGGIDVVIGGPPCQGFSNANRQKNHLISMNNSLVKEYFRAIKEIQPKAFVMENVNMLRSETHRFYESRKDNKQIEDLIQNGAKINFRNDSLYIAKNEFVGLRLEDIEAVNINEYALPKKLDDRIRVLGKNLNNEKRLPKYLEKNAKTIATEINSYTETCSCNEDETKLDIIRRLNNIKHNLEDDIKISADDINYIVSLQKMIKTISEIFENELIGQFEVSEDNVLVFKVRSYPVIEYVDAILGDEYEQDGETLNAMWFGVPQERRRYIVIGVKKSLLKSTIKQNTDITLPKEPKVISKITVKDAIADLQNYEIGYDSNYPPIPYNKGDMLSPYAKAMRKGCKSVSNHIATKTTDVAMERFKAIKQGDNFHSLDEKLKATYSKPERTQNSIYLRLDPDEPSGTVVNVRKSMWIHPFLHRAITVREAARLQSFPDRFIFEGTKDSQYQQVGNAVPPLLAKGIAEKIIEYIE